MSRTGTVWSSLTGNPARFLFSAWPWRSLAYLASSALVGVLVLAVFLVVVAVGVVTSILVIGVFVLATIPALGVAVGAIERRRLRLMQSPGEPALLSPHPDLTGLTLRARLRQVRKEPGSWRELGYAILLAVVLWIVDAVLVSFVATFVGGLALSPLGAAYDQVMVFGWTFDSTVEALPFALVATPIALVISAYLLTAAAAGQAALARLLLSPTEERLAAHVAELRRSRINLVDAFETERRRIERDLHDGVQQRLVALTMTLGRAEMDVPPGEGLDLVKQAHHEAEEALADLRSAVRGIHPRVLVDHGIAAAVREVADRTPIPVSVEISLDARLPSPIEAAAYFVASEGLTNVVKHAGARNGAVVAWVRDDRLVLTVTDDGVGGATVEPGSGLAGLVTRLDALGGTLEVSSPVGGPTRLRMECPCQIEP
ncbi:sensor histidine kinase [Mumia sp. ZJ430]|uniref:sensor histidine kinase n=1 Tax=Mumia sp. ZJ430 TaxID=2708083 RepID=UPI001424943C|nr:sensor histidine kinase [Mumia sp. ZJ430]